MLRGEFGEVGDGHDGVGGGNGDGFLFGEKEKKLVVIGLGVGREGEELGRKVVVVGGDDGRPWRRAWLSCYCCVLKEEEEGNNEGRENATDRGERESREEKRKKK